MIGRKCISWVGTGRIDGLVVGDECEGGFLDGRRVLEVIKVCSSGKQSEFRKCQIGASIDGSVRGEEM